MHITLNGSETAVPEGATLAEVVASLGHDPERPGVAAAVDGQVIRRLDWPDTVINAEQHVEVLTAVQGG